MLIVDLVTPKGLFKTLEVDSLTVKLTSGYRTILGGHTPLVGILDYAPMYVRKNGAQEWYAIHGGAINVTNEKVILICNQIESANTIDVARAENAKKRAEERLKNKGINIDQKRAELALKRAVARLTAAEKK